MEYIFGPVYSKRLGLSLGVDILGRKICSFNCIYCEIGKTEILTTEVKCYVDKALIFNELKEFFKKYPNIQLDWISFSGKGEPSLHTEIDLMIDKIKKKYKFPVAVFTNSAHLNNTEVRSKLLKADLILPSLNAISVKTYKKINLHHGEIKVDDVIEGLFKLKEEFRGFIFLEILFVKGVNDSEEEINLLANFIEKFQPHYVYVNTIYRPAAFRKFEPIKDAFLKIIQNRFEKLIKKRATGFFRKDFITKDQHYITANLLTGSSEIKKAILEVIKNILYIRPSDEPTINLILKYYNYFLENEDWKFFFKSLLEEGIIVETKIEGKNNSSPYYRWKIKN